MPKMDGFAIWIPCLGLIAKPLYEVTEGAVGLDRKQQETFLKLKDLLLFVPAMGIPDLDKLFTL